MSREPDDPAFQPLKDFLRRVPAIDDSIGCGWFDNGVWWLKFSIDIEHRFAWHVVQELGYVLNYISLNERLPTVFKPLSPPPYLNGGPRQFLSWVIECEDGDFTPKDCAATLEGRLPRPVDDLTEWGHEEE